MHEVFRLLATIKTNGAAAVKDFKDVETAGGKTAQKLSAAFKAFAKVLKVAAIAGAVAATVAIVKMGKDGLKAFMEFEEGMNEVFTLLPKITEEAMDSMKEDVKSLAKEMGILPDEIVPALYQAISAGIPMENVFDFMEIASKAAIGGVTTLETAVDGLTSVVNAYGRETMTASEAADIMFTAVRLGKTTFDELSDRLFQVNPIAAALGVNFEEVAAAMAEITSQGTPTRVAATQLRSMFQELSKAGSDVADTFIKITGKPFQDFIAEGGNVADALQILADYAEDNGIKMQDMFGNVEAGQAVLALTGRHLDTYKEKIDEMADSAGAADAAHEKMEKGLKRHWEKIKAWWATVKINIGERLEEPVAHLLEFLDRNKDKIEDFVVGIFDKLLNAFNWIIEHKEGLVTALKAITVGFAALVAIKIATWIGGAVSGFISLAGVIGATGPLGLAIVAATLLIGGLIISLKNAKADAETLAEGSKTAFGSIAGSAEETAKRVDEAVGASAQLQLDLMRKVSQYADEHQEDLTQLTAEELAERVRLEAEAAEELKRMHAVTGEAIVESEQKTADGVVAAQEEQQAAMEETFDHMRVIADEGKTLWQSFVDTLKALTTGLREETLEEWRGIYEGIKGFLNGIFTDTCDMFEKNRKAREDYEKRVAEIREGGFENEKELLDDAAKAYEEERVTVWGILWQGVKDFVKAIREKFVAIAAEQTALGIIAALTGNVIGAIAHGAAALKAGAVAVGLAVAGLQEGGIVTRPTLALLAERGIPEMVIPLPRISSAFQPGQLAYAGAGGGQTVIEDGAIRIAEGATFYVREEADIERIAKELGDEFDDRVIGKGRVTP